MPGHRRGRGGHVQLVGQRVAVDPVAARQPGDVHAGRRAPDALRGRREFDRGARQRPVTDLGQPEWVCQAELQRSRRLARSQEAPFEMHRRAVGQLPALLSVEKVGLTDMLEDQFFAVLECLDRRKPAPAFTAPRPEQERQRRHVSVQRRSHVATVPRRAARPGFGQSCVSRRSTACWRSITSASATGSAGVAGRSETALS